MSSVFFEAIVVDSKPDSERPGCISVKIPELFLDEEVPVLVEPLIPGWTAGGWQSIPGEVDPDNSNGDVRVIVIKLGDDSYRWLGHSQTWSWIEESPGDRQGARSADGRYWMRMSADDGIEFSVDGDAVSTFDMSKAGLITVKAPDIDIIADHITMKGSGPVGPLHGFLLTSEFLTDLMSSLNEVVAIGAGIPAGLPVPATNTISLIAKITTSLSAGAPYVSTRTKSN